MKDGGNSDNAHRAGAIERQPTQCHERMAATVTIVDGGGVEKKDSGGD